MAGRKPILSVVKATTGKKGRGINKLEPKFPKSIPDCPSWLRSGVAKKEWKKVTKLLSEAGILTIADGNSLAMYCYIISEIDRLTEALSGEDADIIKIEKMDSLGNKINETKINPRTIRLENYIKELRYYSALFGLDPVDRGRIKAGSMPKPKGKDKERFFDD
jgi:P27 family predicted phage terminase small subunit